MTSNSKIVSFLYELMRDHLPCGTVEELVRASEHDVETVYSNKNLAEYAKELAKRLGDKDV